MEFAWARQRLFEKRASASIDPVALEVYIASRPAIPLRAWLSSILLLTMVSGLAGWMSWSRSSDSLAARVEPEDWDISFRPPRQFKPLAADTAAPTYAIAYRTTTASGGGAELVFRRIEAAKNLDADEICDLILRPHASLLLAIFAAPPTRTIETLGPLDAVQVHYSAIPMVVRAIRLQNGYGYAVSLRVEGGPFDEPLYRSFDLACRAVDFKLSSGADR